ncbi:hypothetical protein BGZ94_003459 [Podila epigama]|nr:hypothetical protein BGZ94_003459 [Podila epigama]
MRPPNTTHLATTLRKNYIQQCLTQFLRRVHPDLFQKHPAEQLKNSASLQDLLPLVQQELRGGAQITDTHSPASKSASLVFYCHPKEKGAADLIQVEHVLPIVDTLIPLDNSADTTKQSVLEREVRSWEMVQSFMELCRKVGVPIKELDRLDVNTQLEQSLQDAKSASKFKTAPHKPIGEIFAQELQESFAGSLGNANIRRSDTHLPTENTTSDGGASSSTQLNDSTTLLGKIGGSAPALDAQVMIQTNPLLFKSPNLSATKLGRLIRTWIYWQEEDEHLETSPHARFRLSSWWRKVPIMIASSALEHKSMLQSGSSGGGGTTQGMLVVHPEMTKEDMIQYLVDNLDRVQIEYRDMLQKAGTMQGNHNPSSAPTPNSKKVNSDDVASYLAKMRAQSRPSHQRR